ncbi:hypothetical protein FRB90_011780, partial [Tulasnella sp. 427]
MEVVPQQQQHLLAPRISTMDLDKVTSFSFPLTPPTTPPKASLGPTYYISSPAHSSFQHQQCPPSPTIIINTPKPWYSSKGFTFVVFGLLGFFAFSIHQLSPLIGSTASTVRSFGDVVESVATTTRISAGIADGVGEVWCTVFGGKRCAAAPLEASNVAEPSDTVTPVGSNALLEGAKIVGTLKQLAVVNTNLSAASELRVASPDFDKSVRGRNAALRGTLAYNAVVLVSNSATSLLDSPFTSRRAPQELLSDELVHMARYTFANYHAAKHQFRELRLTSRSLYATGQRVLGPARKQLN